MQQAVHRPGTEAMRLLAQMGRPTRFRRGEVLLRQGDPPDALFVLERGAVRAIRRDGNRRGRVVRTYDPVSLIGEVSVLAGEPHAFTARAASEVEAVRVEADDLRAALERSPRLAHALLVALARELLDAQGRMRRLPTERAPQRLAGLLVDLLRGTGEARVSATRSELAEMVGLRRETASRILARWAADGIVRAGYRSIEVVDPARLEAIARGEAEPADEG